MEVAKIFTPVTHYWLIQMIFHGFANLRYLDNIPIYWWVKKFVIYSNRGNWVNLRYIFDISSLAWLRYIEYCYSTGATAAINFALAPSHSPNHLPPMASQHRYLRGAQIGYLAERSSYTTLLFKTLSVKCRG